MIDNRAQPTLFRPQRGSLRRALLEQVVIIDAADLQRHVRHVCGDAEVVNVLYYGKDDRMAEWTETYIVIARWPDGSTGPAGFVNATFVVKENPI